jgi:hypothetical protein
MDINALVHQPAGNDMPAQGSSGAGSAGPLQTLMGGGGGAAPGGAPGIPMQKPPAPSYEQTVAALKHIHTYDQKWRDLLADPGVGSKDQRKPFNLAMADLMGDGFCTLPQTLTLLKSFPDDPLEQRKWLEKHVQQDEQAMGMILQQYAQSAGPPAHWDIMKNKIPSEGGGGLANDHLKTIDGLMGHYKERSPRKRPSAAPVHPGIPMRQG